MEDSLSKPFFVLFRNLCMTPEGDPSRSLLLTVLAEFARFQKRLGYHLLYFLKAR
jgi:integrator complex subunit 3